MDDARPHQTCVLAHTLVRILEERLEAAGLPISASDALTDLGRIQQQVPLHEGRIRITTIATPDEQQRAILVALGARLPPQHHVT